MLLMCFWIQLASILLRTFASVFISDVGCSFLFLLGCAGCPLQLLGSWQNAGFSSCGVQASTVAAHRF